MLAGVTHNISSKEIISDPRYKRHPTGLSKQMREALRQLQSNEASGSPSLLFEPGGDLHLANPVKFYLSTDLSDHVATLTNGVLLSQTQYGLEVQLVKTRFNGGFLEAIFEIRNLSGIPQSIVWYVGDSYRLTITSTSANGIRSAKTIGQAILDKKPLQVSVQAYNTDPAKPLGSKACLFCGAQNTPRDITSFRTDFVSDFTVAELEDFERTR